MRKITAQIREAFYYGESKTISNTSTDGNAIYLHGNKIAEKRDGYLWITNAGWRTNTTKNRLNSLARVNIQQRNGVWYLNGKEWNGEWTNVGLCN